MELTEKKVLFDKNIKMVRRTYIDSFELRERMPFPMMLGMSILWNTEFYSFYDKDTFCGLIYMAHIGRQAFVMFFAVPEGSRSKGYGSAILKKVRELYKDKQLIISIEPCGVECNNPEQRIRRKEFYKRNRYMPTGYMMKLMGETQEILLLQDEYTTEETATFKPGAFKRFFMLYSNGVIFPKIWKIEE